MCEEKTLDRSPVPPLEAWIKTRQADAPAWPNNRSCGSSKAYAGNIKNLRRRSAAKPQVTAQGCRPEFYSPASQEESLK